MKLPQDRILHIDTELAGDEVRVVAEWQGEIVRCKDCRCYNNDYMGKWCGRHQAPVWVEEDDFCSYGKRREGDTE